MRVDIPETLLPGMTTDLLLAAAAATAGSEYHVDVPMPRVLRVTWSRNRFRRAGLIGVAMMDRTKTLTVIVNDSPDGVIVKVAGETSSRFGSELRAGLEDLAAAKA
jgi:hypothetical protein